MTGQLLQYLLSSIIQVSMKHKLNHMQLSIIIDIMTIGIQNSIWYSSNQRRTQELHSTEEVFNLQGKDQDTCILIPFLFNGQNYVYKEWFDQPETRNISMIQCFKHKIQEPYLFLMILMIFVRYVIVKKSEHLPIFPESLYMVEIRQFGLSIFNILDTSLVS